LFIVIHQVYELWFKQLLHEGESLRTSLVAANVPASLATLRRMCTILKTLVSQVDILETMTPLSFNSFRSHLRQASGFQSAQFRELEIFLGRRDPQLLAPYLEGSPQRARLTAAAAAASVYEALISLLAKRGYDVPGELLRRDSRQPLAPSEAMQSLLIDVYRSSPELMAVCERFVDFDEGLQEWRYRHVKMVERTIGAKMGTGGSSGAEYLKGTLFRPFFPDLWAIRAAL
ncbi:MAG TPA: tryptophan 2,3-dioxygenase family protein, partial [Myxococcota bacterium]|nr:tryptophan 2,3-dioxygenase family protein [Myxococcota bacterium]